MDLHSSGQKTRPHMTSHVVPYLPALCLQLSSSAIVVAGLKPRTSLCFCVAFGLTVRHKQKHIRSRCFQCAWRNISERAQSHSSLLLDPRGSSSPCLRPVSQSVSSSAADAVWVATGDELKTMQCNLFNKHARFSASTP